MKFVINGSFTQMKPYGVARYAFELTQFLDRLISNEKKMDIELYVPRHVILDEIITLKEIKVIKCKHTFSQILLFDQLIFPIYCYKQKAIGINFCNITSFIKPNCIVTIHDCNLFLPEWGVINNKLTLRMRLIRIYLIMSGLLAAKFSKHIFTVSEYSKNQIISYYGARTNNVSVTYCGYEHFLGAVEKIKKADILLKYYLTEENYLFSIARNARSKNLEWIIAAARQNLKYFFIVTGDAPPIELPNNIKFIGFLSDDELKVLIENCYAFIFPSSHEGFGMPPLEAISVGCKRIIVSNTSCLTEIYGKYVYYIDPFDYENINIDNILQQTIIDSNKDLLDKYTWVKSATIFYNQLLALK